MISQTVDDCQSNNAVTPSDSSTNDIVPQNVAQFITLNSKDTQQKINGDLKKNQEDGLLSQKRGELLQMMKWLDSHGLPILPVAPKQDSYKYPKKVNGEIVYKKDKDGNLTNEPEPLFTGKNPSYLDKEGIPHIVSHKKYQDKLPTKKERDTWFVNPANGIGTLGTDHIKAIDIDAKNFDSQADCDIAYNGILEKNSALKQTFLAQTHSGGYRIFVKEEKPSSFTNFSLEENGKHIGECLGYGRFTVLPPTLGVSGNYYEVLNWGEIIEVESVESIGIYPVKKAAKEKAEKQAKDKPTNSKSTNRSKVPQVLEGCLTDSTKEIIDGICGNVSNRSEVLAKVANEVYGWRNWLNNNQISFIDNSDDLINRAGESLGIDSDRIQRVIKPIDSNNVVPAAEFMGGDKACWKRIRKLDKKIFNENCPRDVKNEIEGEYKALTAENEPYRVTTTADDSVLKVLFENGEGDWKVINDGYHQYTGFYWRYISDAVVQKKITDTLRQLYLVDKNTGEQIYCYANEKNKASAFKFCRSNLSQESELFNNHLLCFKNGTVDVRTGELSAHSREDFLTSYIDSDYVRGAECPAVFKEFVNNAFGEDMLPLIRALTSMYVDPTAHYGYFAHLIGESGSGKGTMIRFWGSMFGETSLRSVQVFSDISTAEKRHQHLTNVRFCSLPDVGGYQKDLRAFYELVDNGSASGRALFSSTGYEKRWYVRFAIASVNPLSIENSGDGWERRAIELPTNKRKGNKDPDLETKLQEVKAQVISWALAMPREDRDNTLMNASKLFAKVKAAKQEQRVHGDSISYFVDQCLRPSEKATDVLQPAELHDAYMLFCKAHGLQAKGSAGKLRGRLAHSSMSKIKLRNYSGNKGTVPRWYHSPNLTEMYLCNLFLLILWLQNFKEKWKSAGKESKNYGAVIPQLMSSN
ncbi:hypothetical protein NIES2101_00335 [Calothrix sp. HK-06]|nr:hypothetical protein NIES2101_00335 [Calothrix sp. HK-06]